MFVSINPIDQTLTLI